MDNNSLSHTKWNCKYHIVFAPKYRRKVAYGKIKQCKLRSNGMPVPLLRNGYSIFNGTKYR